VDLGLRGSIGPTVSPAGFVIKEKAAYLAMAALIFPA
jgi:hypothetical protein